MTPHRLHVTIDATSLSPQHFDSYEAAADALLDWIDALGLQETRPGVYEPVVACAMNTGGYRFRIEEAQKSTIPDCIGRFV